MFYRHVLESIDISVLLHGYPFELVLHLKQILLQSSQSVLDYLGRVLMGSLHFDFHHVVQRVGHFVACELHVFVLKQVDAK